MNHESVFDHHHLIVSYELLQLLRWIITTEPESLKIIMHNAIQNGFLEHMTRMRTAQGTQQSNEELQQTVIEFFEMLEIELHDAATNVQGEAPAQKALNPAIQHVDSSLCDEETLAVSVAQATSQLKTHTPQQAKEMLCKEILKNWRPRSHLLQ
jgi:hypothetical protein